MTPPRPLDATHRCPGRCGRSVRQHLTACTRCMRRLPVELRVPLQAIREGRTNADHNRRLQVVTDARDWWLEHKAPHDPDHAIAGQCEYCDEPLIWLTTGSGKRLPANADPDPERGNIVRTGHVAGVLGAGAAAAARATGTPLWLHHAVTCTDAAEWNSKRKPGQRGPDRKATRS